MNLKKGSLNLQENKSHEIISPGKLSGILSH